MNRSLLVSKFLGLILPGKRVLSFLDKGIKITDPILSDVYIANADNMIKELKRKDPAI